MAVHLSIYFSQLLRIDGTSDEINNQFNHQLQSFNADHKHVLENIYFLKLMSII